MEKKFKWKTMLVSDIVGGLFIAVALAVFAKNAEFATGGISGVALIVNYLFKTPMGIFTLALNIPIIILSYKSLGKNFFLRSLKTMIIGSIILDLVTYYVPVYTGDKLLASIFTGLLSGIGYALVYLQGSSTGGSDFIILLLRKKYPHLSIGTITQVIDGSVVLLGVLVYKNIDTILYGLISMLLCTVVVDKIMLGASTNKLIFVISKHVAALSEAISATIGRGSTFLDGTRSYSKEKTQVLMCACSLHQAAAIKNIVYEMDEHAFMIVMDSSEIHGKGFLEKLDT